jgi:hypothetical protein
MFVFKLIIDERPKTYVLGLSFMTITEGVGD